MRLMVLQPTGMAGAVARGVPLLPLILVLTLIPTPTAAELGRPIRYTVTEETRPGAPIGNVIRDANLSLSYTRDDLSKLSFDFLPNDRNTDGLLNISADGYITIKRRIDRESYCARMDLCVLTLDIGVKPQTFFRIIKIEVEIVDINDNAPVFYEAVVNLTIPESSMPGTVLAIPVPDDTDGPDYGVKKYELKSDMGVFKLKDMKNAVTEEVYIELAAKLDRESVDFYQVKIVAFDGGDTPRVGEVTLNIHVSDTNDNNPVFTKETYLITLDENSGVNTELIQVHATDGDSQGNTDLVYSFAHRTVKQFGDTFMIDNITGVITLTKSLDYEQILHYTLVAVVQDNYGQQESLSGDAVVIVNVRDLNDNTPVIVLNSVHKEDEEIVINENDNPGAPVIHVSATDADTGLSGQVSCRVNSTFFTITQLYDTDFMIETAVPIDREKNPYLYIRITCQDKGTPRQGSYNDVRITVKDRNDFAPRFDSVLNVTLVRSAKVGTTITKVKATDLDLGVNAEVRYYFRDEVYQHLFDLNSVSGEITTRVSFWDKPIWRLKMTLTAIDQGQPQLTGDTIIFLSILSSGGDPQTPPTASGPPTLPLLIFNATENQREGTFVGSVSDAWRSRSSSLPEQVSLPLPVAPVEFFLLEDKTNFLIDRQTSLLYTTRPLDREITNQYLITCMLIFPKEGDTEKVEVIQIIVKVIDLNDNPPQIIFPSPRDSAIVISDSLSVGPNITVIRAEDPDTGDNALLTYSLKYPTHGTISRPFAVHPHTGVIYSIVEIPLEKFKAFGPMAIDIQVADGGSPSLSTERTIHFIFNSSAGPHSAGGKQGLISTDSLAITLAIAVPCALVVVFVIVLVAALCRRRHSQKHKQDENSTSFEHKHVTFKRGMAERSSGKKLDILSAAELKTREINGDIYKPVSSAASDTDTPQRKIIYTDPTSEIPTRGLSLNPSTSLAKDRDSDSGCSADLSNSTSDSWTSSAAGTCPASDNGCSLGDNRHPVGGATDDYARTRTDEVPLADVAAQHRRLLASWHGDAWNNGLSRIKEEPSFSGSNTDTPINPVISRSHSNILGFHTSIDQQPHAGVQNNLGRSSSNPGYQHYNNNQMSIGEGAVHKSYKLDLPGPLSLTCTDIGAPGSGLYNGEKVSSSGSQSSDVADSGVGDCGGPRDPRNQMSLDDLHSLESGHSQYLPPKTHPRRIIREVHV